MAILTKVTRVELMAYRMSFVEWKGKHVFVDLTWSHLQGSPHQHWFHRTAYILLAMLPHCYDTTEIVIRGSLFHGLCNDANKIIVHVQDIVHLLVLVDEHPL